MDVLEPGDRVEIGEQIDRILGEISDSVVLECDVGGLDSGSGGCRPPERRIEDGHGSQEREAFDQPTVWTLWVGDQHERELVLVRDICEIAFLQACDRRAL